RGDALLKKDDARTAFEAFEDALATRPCGQALLGRILALNWGATPRGPATLDDATEDDPGSPELAFAQHLRAGRTLEAYQAGRPGAAAPREVREALVRNLEGARSVNGDEPLVRALAVSGYGLWARASDLWGLEP